MSKRLKRRVRKWKARAYWALGLAADADMHLDVLSEREAELKGMVKELQDEVKRLSEGRTVN